MPREEYFTYSKIYTYNEESPYEGAVAEGVPGARTLVGEVTWSADVIWNEALGKYEVDTYWDDHGNHFSHIGEGPNDDEFWDDLYDYLDNQGVDLDEVG